MATYETTDSRGPGKPFAPRNVENAEVDEPGMAWHVGAEERGIINDLLGGTLAMRKAKRAYLPQYEFETNAAYERRVKQTMLNNYTLRTLNTLVGKAFKEPPQPAADTDDGLVDFMDDVDGAGTGFVPFSREAFRAGIRDAVAYILVDAPAAPEDGSKPTLATAGSPTWRLIAADDMLDYREGPTAEGIKPTLIRFRDDVIEDDGEFGSKVVKRRKVIRPDRWELWELQTGPRGGSPKWVRTQEGALTNTFVYVVPFYTDKQGCGCGRPPLADLAHLNVRHWQSTSDQNNALTAARFPIFTAVGIDDQQPQAIEDLTMPAVVVGPNKFLQSSNPQAKFEWVEHGGAALESGTTDLERLEAAMASYGAQFLKQDASGPESASGRVIDEAESISPLQAWGLDFRDALMLALSYTAEMMGKPDANYEVDFEIDGEVDQANQAELSALDSARGRKDISRETYLDELKRRNVLSEDFDPDTDKELLDAEPPPPGMGLDGMNTGLAGGKAPPKKASPPPSE